MTHPASPDHESSGNESRQELFAGTKVRIERPIGRMLGAEEAESVGSLLFFSARQMEEFRLIASQDKLACIVYVRYLLHRDSGVKLHDAMLFVEDIVVNGGNVNTWWTEQCELNARSKAS